MNKLQIGAIVAGMLFGAWPIIMNKSGLRGGISAVVMGSIGLVVILPFALRELSNGMAMESNANWKLAFIAGVMGAIGFLLFCGLLAKVEHNKLCSFIVLVTVLQIAVPASYSAIVNGGITMSQGLGFIAAIAATILLAK